MKYHVVGLKCLNCGSYNTCRVKGSPSPGKIRNLLLFYFLIFGDNNVIFFFSLDDNALDEAAGGSSTDNVEQSQR